MLYSHTWLIRSFGIVLLEAISLKLPYEGLTPHAIAAQLDSGQRPECSDMQAAAAALPSSPLATLVALMLRCTDQHPERRPTANDAVAILETLGPFRPPSLKVPPTPDSAQLSASGSDSQSGNIRMVRRFKVRRSPQPAHPASPATEA